MRSWLGPAVLLLVVGGAILVTSRRTPALTRVGSERCAECHAEVFGRWKTSQHARALAAARESTVQSDFSGAELTHDGVTSRFFRRGSAFLVHTDGPDGGLADFEVTQTLGVFPLQQYLVTLPSGRVQALRTAWDTRAPDAGGQRWFALYPTEHLDAADELHWTGPQQRWNFMCADCHATGVKKGFDAQAQTYATTFTEPGVGCESCHGPGSVHVALGTRAGLTVTFDERKDVRWTRDAVTGRPTRSRTRTTERELEVCAQCHARRSQFSEAYRPGAPLEDHYRLSRLTADAFHPNGQQKDEVFTWASFATSRMFARGVTCGDCHEPHGGTLRAEGNALCAGCHAAERYDAPTHHFHAPGSAGTKCIACHMPTATFMVVDARHDHGFRIPQPRLTESLGVPNACTACHADQPASWAAQHLERWFPQPKVPFQDFASAFAAADREDPDATDGLLALLERADEPALVRASALDRLAALAKSQGSDAEFPDPTPRRNEAPAADRKAQPDDDAPAQATRTTRVHDAASAALADGSPLVRQAAAAFFDSVSLAERGPVAPLLRDSVRAVRLEAARVLAPIPPEALLDFAPAARSAWDEYVAAERFNADRPEHRANLGVFFTQRGQLVDAEREYLAALQLDGRFVKAWVNLADLYRAQGREPEAETTLRDGLRVAPGAGVLHYALGLSLVRQRRMEDARVELRRASQLEPGNRAFAEASALAEAQR